MSSGLKRAILTAVASVALFGCGWDDAWTAYLVTVSSVGSSVMGGGSYEGGATVFIVAGTPPPGYKFDSWTTASRGVIFDDAMSAATWFTMPANNVTVTANFLQGAETPPGHTHVWGDWVVTTPATCNAAGIETRTCTLDPSHKESRFIPKLTGASCNPGGWSDGAYELVTIDGKKWMKKNLNIETPDSWCYENIAANCDKYGRLYIWEAAKTACQSIWMRLPSNEEWEDLVMAAGGASTAGKKLKSTNGWNWNDVDGKSGNGTNEMGISILPGGFRNPYGTFSNVGNGGGWWTAEELSSGNAYGRGIYYNKDSVREVDSDKNYGVSARCVQD